ncbi:MAG: HPr family phosphocarrier protein [Oscillospiraceae bacterium]|nr:HPr family phosphocarrier protein [Oscillospiraceae bacterium]MBQ2741981.1 HPr family phosphocarrier protein [Oscillospiraceae bacterium]MBQ3224229.1 HPr family phosphocarrier protein [Oscillospiraceae bacterium]MBQ4316567.1 HPr family phosphocarrier protein [Oscillospiraceae bacterium]MBQ6698889.1 HPr family phosphocarrier protein [Oscillospiraceae bacterium]
MYNFKITLSSINEVKSFVNAACSQMCDIDIISGRYVIDAKSIMGIFSIDLTKPVTVSVNGTEEEYKAFRELVKDIVVED